MKTILLMQIYIQSIEKNNNWECEANNHSLVTALAINRGGGGGGKCRAPVYTGIIYRYHIQVSYTGIIYRYHIQVSYTGIMYRYHIQVSYTGIIYRYHIQVSYTGIIYRYHIQVLYTGCSNKNNTETSQEQTSHN